MSLLNTTELWIVPLTVIYFVVFFTVCCVMDSKSEPIQDGEQIFVPVKSPLLFHLMLYISMVSVCFLNKLRVLLGSVDP